MQKSNYVTKFVTEFSKDTVINDVTEFSKDTYTILIEEVMRYEPDKCKIT